MNTSQTPSLACKSSIKSLSNFTQEKHWEWVASSDKDCSHLLDTDFVLGVRLHDFLDLLRLNLQKNVLED